MVKLKNTTDDNMETAPPSKKVRLGFSIQSFQKRLKTDEKATALEEFVKTVIEEPTCVKDYLSHGGNCLDLLHTMEDDSPISPVLVFEAVNHVLLQINANIPKYQNLAYDSCQYLLNNYTTLINRMIGLSSSTKERLATLKLLTTMATISPVLAKEILLNVTFKPPNLELLTKVSEKNDVRAAFVHFIMALLVDGQYATLSILLERKGLLTSIINGLQFDPVEVVVLVMAVLKEHVLENASVSKTAKMKTFSTPVVKSIVNLYNWKGPGGITDSKKGNKTLTVDELSKSRVNEAVHSFLLVLCTSHKYGVVFKDRAVGLSKKQNSLMYTVLDSLERPWEHSYAGDLVIEITKACPDLTRTTWANLRPFLEPRWTTKWLNAVNFAHRLLEAMQPDRIEFYISELGVQQMTQLIPTLVAPSGVLKVLLPENGMFERVAVKYNVLRLLLRMLKSVECYLSYSGKWVDEDVLRKSLANYVSRNFPDAKFVLRDWDKSDEDCTVSDYLETALDFLEKCKVLAPQTVQEAEPFLDIAEFLHKTETVLSGSKLKRFRVRVMRFFVGFEPRLFKPKTELFELAVKTSLEFYYEEKDSSALCVLRDVFQNSGIFDGFLVEMDFWIDGVHNLKNYDEVVGTFFCKLIRVADDEALEYNRKLFECKNGNFSTLVLVLKRFVEDVEISKSLKSYITFVILNLFHLQSDSTSFCEVISELSFLPIELRSYIEKWKISEPAVLNKCKGNVFEYFRKFSCDFVEGKLNNFDFDIYPNLSLNLLQVSIFYLTNLIEGGTLSENHKENIQNFVKCLFSKDLFRDDRYVKAVLGNIAILKQFDLLDSNNFVTEFVTSIVQKLKNVDIEHYLADFRRKIVSTLSKVFKKPQKYSNFVVPSQILETFKLEYEACYKLTEKFSTSKDNKIYFLIASYCLNRMAELVANDYNLKPLDDSIIKELSHILSLLIKDQINDINRFSAAFLKYLKTFPHCIQNVDCELFENILTTTEYQKDNLLLAEFLLRRKNDFLSVFEIHLDEICSKKSFLLSLLPVVIEHGNELLEKIFEKFKPHIIKALQKPHKAGQHFHNNYESVGILVEKFMNFKEFGSQIQKFEVTELFHVYLLKKIYLKGEWSAKNLENMITTFVHLLINLLKQKSGAKEVKNFQEICEVFANFLSEIKSTETTISTETFRLFHKLCLKYGLEGDIILLKILSELVEYCVEEDAKLILDMLFSHSQFLDVVLGDSDRGDLLNLWLKLCTKWPQFMEKNHVPILLSSYRTTRNQTDQTVLKLLKLYELNENQTNFYDFKPFLWGRAAISYYSVRSNVQQVLWRQPKIGDILNNLNQATILATIADPQSPAAYDLNYFLPLFSHLLAPENPVQVYHFIKSGALALTITGLSGDRDRKLATFHVLSRFHFHLEARQSGKDNLLWLRLVEVICKGLAAVEDFALNGFAAVFLARAALVLTRPSDVMYLPLSRYLGAKDLLDFGTVPELYTLLHSPHVDFKEHRTFILEVVRDGLRDEKDFGILLRSMGFKLISELCSNGFCDSETKCLILEVFRKCCKLGVRILGGSLAFLTQISGLWVKCVKELKENEVFVKLLEIFREIVYVDENRHRNFLVYLNLIALCEDDASFKGLVESGGLAVYYETLLVVVKRFPSFFRDEDAVKLLEKSEDRFCKYLFKYKCQFVNEADFIGDASVRNYLRLLFYNKLK